MNDTLLVKEITVPAAPGAVFSAFLDGARVQQFFAPFAIVEPVVGGRYHLDFTVTEADEAEAPDDESVCRIHKIDDRGESGGTLIVDFADPPIALPKRPRTNAETRGITDDTQTQHRRLTIVVFKDESHGGDARIRFEQPFDASEDVLRRWWLHAWATLLARMVRHWKVVASLR